jgi:hypothetical protein
MNSATYDSRDGNLVISSRHQAQVYKIAYENGAGDGHIIWTLGKGGNVRLASGVPASTWFSYQHDVAFQPNRLLSLFDNNTLAHIQDGANSRGQVWNIDEKNLIATPVLNVDLGTYSGAVGYASELANGNYHFSAGYVNNATQSNIYEYTPSGTLVYQHDIASFEYRTIRLQDLYTTR